MKDNISIIDTESKYFSSLIRLYVEIASEAETDYISLSNWSTPFTQLKVLNVEKKLISQRLRSTPSKQLQSAYNCILDRIVSLSAMYSVAVVDRDNWPAALEEIIVLQLPSKQRHIERLMEIVAPSRPKSAKKRVKPKATAAPKEDLLGFCFHVLGIDAFQSGKDCRVLFTKSLELWKLHSGQPKREIEGESLVTLKRCVRIYECCVKAGYVDLEIAALQLALQLKQEPEGE